MSPCGRSTGVAGISRKMLNVLMQEAREDGVQAFTLGGARRKRDRRESV